MHRKIGKTKRKKQVQKKIIHLMIFFPLCINLNTIQISLYFFYKVIHLYVKVEGEKKT